MVRLIGIAALCAVVVDVLWFVLFTQYNRRKGALVLAWVDAACSSRGRLLESSLVKPELPASAPQFRLSLV